MSEDKNITTPHVSEKWLTKFELLKKIGADEKPYYTATKSPEFKKLSFREKHKINFNWLAFFFGPFYYFSKKMWFKGSFILGSIWLLNGIFSIVESAFSLTLPGIIFWIIPASFCSSLANYDYFKAVTENEKFWKGWPEIFSKPIGALGYPVMSFLFLLFSVGVFDSGVPACSSSEVKKVVVEISKDELTQQRGETVSNSISITLSSIRTTARNEQTGAYQCAANLDLLGSNVENSLPITYTIEVIDKSQEFYVEVFGL